ncbi:MAG: hypothetical protein PUP92_00240 [Rhizonema sp. PD38]|nr:hypothetical protein [Rhizonema sp. PD38]
MKYYLSLLFSLILVFVLQSGNCLNIAQTFAVDRIGGEQSTSGLQTSQSISSILPIQLIEKEHFKAHPVTVNRIHFSPNGQRLVSASQDGTARLWTSSGQMLAEFKGHNRPVFNASFSPDEQKIITAGYDGTARIWSLSGQQLTKLIAHQAAVTNAIFSPNGQRVISNPGKCT